jgi:pilus assembly protein CpaE
MALLPCKGGSGATFLTTNLGWMLARKHSVLLIDLNLQFGDTLAYLHEAKPASTLADVARDIHRLDASFLTASTVKITPRCMCWRPPKTPCMPWRWSRCMWMPSCSWPPRTMTSC